MRVALLWINDVNNRSMFFEKRNISIAALTNNNEEVNKRLKLMRSDKNGPTDLQNSYPRVMAALKVLLERV